MKNDIRACYTLANIVIICKVAPNDFNRRVVLIILELDTVLFASSEEKNKVILILSLINLLKTGISHVAGCSGQKYGLFAHHNPPKL